jgi:hypothetical protein
MRSNCQSHSYQNVSGRSNYQSFKLKCKWEEQLSESFKSKWIAQCEFH